MKVINVMENQEKQNRSIIIDQLAQPQQTGIATVMTLFCVDDVLLQQLCEVVKTPILS